MPNTLICLGIFIFVSATTIEPHTTSAFYMHIALILFGMVLAGCGVWLNRR
jgi:hypothetical protein